MGDVNKLIADIKLMVYLSTISAFPHGGKHDLHPIAGR